MAILNNFKPFSPNIQPTYLNKFGNVPYNHVYSQNYNKTPKSNISNNISESVKSKDLSLSNKNENARDTKEEENKDSREFFEIFGIRLYFDDILILCLLYFLYKEDVHDEMLFFALILLLIS